MTRLGNTNFSIFIQCQYLITILRNKNMGQSLFKKHSEFQNFDETSYYGINRLNNKNLDAFMPCHYTKTILRKKNMGKSLFKERSNFIIFNKNFNCDMAKRGHR